VRVVVVGGGTAGWMVTYYLSESHLCVNVSTEEIPIIGVGEGTTGKFLDVFKMDHVSMMHGMDALPKLGIKFDNWSKTKQSFLSPIDGTPTASKYIDYTCLAYGPVGKHITLMNGNKSNFFVEQPDLMCDYNQNALHLDAYKTGEFFKSQSKLLKHYDAKVVKVNREEGFIKSIELDTGETIEGDLFVDCSGFARVLSAADDWVDYSEYLPVNRALVYKTETESSRKPYTLATARKYGWTWEIPTRTKIGKGYVYCDKYASEDDILEELGDVEKVKSIEFKSGRITKFLDKNCLSLGLSSGFLEPLQATSIHLTLMQLERFAYGYPTEDLLLDNEMERDYNDYVASLHDSMRDFVSLHYSGGKTDTDFWKDARVTPFVDKIISLTKKRLPRSFDFPKIGGGVAQESYNPILWGLGHFNNCPVKQTFDSDNASMVYWASEAKKFGGNTSKYLTIDELNDIIASLGKT
jgi:tryptophan halogenase